MADCEAQRGAVDVQSVDTEKNWRDKPAVIYSLVVDFYTRIKINIFYDADQLELEDVKIVHNLDNLCLCFTRINTDKGKFTAECPVDFRARIGCWKFLRHRIYDLQHFDCNNEAVRFRIGPFLTQIFEVRSIQFQGAGEIDDEKSWRTVYLYASNSKQVHYLRILNDLHYFTISCGSRGIKVQSPEPRNVFIPTEIAALLSSYFYNRFYLNYKEDPVESGTLFANFKYYLDLVSHKEDKNKWIEIQNCNADILLIVIRNSVFRFNRLFALVNNFEVYIPWEKQTDQLRCCQRFSFNRQFIDIQKDIKMIMEHRFHGFEEETVKGMQNMSNIVCNYGLMHSFMAKFCLLEFLEQWEKRYSSQISSEFAAIIAQRKAQLQNIYLKRPKLRLRYVQGDIVCSLFDDFHPVLVNSLISYTVGGVGIDLSTGQPKISLSQRLQRDARSRRGIFGVQQVHPEELLQQVPESENKPHQQLFFLLYRNSRTQLRVSSSLDEGWLVGVVIAGQELIEANRGGNIVKFVVEKS